MVLTSCATQRNCDPSISGFSSSSPSEERQRGKPRLTSFSHSSRCNSGSVLSPTAVAISQSTNSPESDNQASVASRLQGPPAYVAATKSFRPVDAIDRPVGPFLRFSHIFAKSRDTENAPTHGDEPAVLRGGAGLEDLDIIAIAR